MDHPTPHPWETLGRSPGTLSLIPLNGLSGTRGPGQGWAGLGTTGTWPQGAGSSIKAKALRCPARRWSGVPVAQVSSSVVTMPREVSTPIYHHMRTVG